MNKYKKIQNNYKRNLLINIKILMRKPKRELGRRENRF
jgi:hypothetical protein